MITTEPEKVIIVEGTTDKRQIGKIIDDEVNIICTNGTFAIERFDELLEAYDLYNKEVFIFVDEDEPGMKLRKQLANELPFAEHLHVSSEYREVATTPRHVLAETLLNNRISIDPSFLLKEIRGY